jgi:hypothetical protein
MIALFFLHVYDDTEESKSIMGIILTQLTIGALFRQRGQGQECSIASFHDNHSSHLFADSD